jgi:hypothetical protein
MSVQQCQRIGGRHRGREPYHSQVLPARPFNEHIIPVEDNSLQRYTPGLCEEDPDTLNIKPGLEMTH